MTDAFFDILYEGTTIEDCIKLEHMKSENVLVYDNKNEYGTTYRSVEFLKASKFITNVKVKKCETSITFESNPFFLRPHDEITKLLVKSGTIAFCDFIKVPDRFLVTKDGEKYKIPCDTTEIIDASYFTMKDKLLFRMFIDQEISSDELINKMSHKTLQILRDGIAGGDNKSNACIFDYIKEFDATPFYYPIYGLKDIVELISRSNAINGVSYLLDETIKVYKLVGESEMTEQGCSTINVTHSTLSKERVDRTIIDCSRAVGDINIDDVTCVNKMYTEEKYAMASYEMSAENRTSVSNNEDKRFVNHKTMFVQEKSTTSKPYIDDIHRCLHETRSSNICKSEPVYDDIRILLNLNTGNFEHVDDIPDDVHKHISNGYKYLIKSVHGNIYGKKLHRKNITDLATNIRILNVKQSPGYSNSFTWLNSGEEFVKVLCIDSSTKCCDKDTCIVYLISTDTEIFDEHLQTLNIKANDVMFDVSFTLLSHDQVMC